MSPSKLQAFYNAIDVFVNPTLRPQGLDLTLMEVMMSGKPVMASRFRSIKGRIVVNDEFGFMFAPNIASLLEALELAVKEGSRSLNNFSRNHGFGSMAGVFAHDGGQVDVNNHGLDLLLLCDVERKGGGAVAAVDAGNLWSLCFKGRVSQQCGLVAVAAAEMRRRRLLWSPSWLL
ncbi:hypothetical protein ACLB2K_066771 [Fragaria x ananassa]